MCMRDALQFFRPIDLKMREKMYRKEQPETSHKWLSYRTNHKVGSHSRELQR